LAPTLINQENPMNIHDLAKTHASDWESRGYALSADQDGKPTVIGNTGAFCRDAVSNQFDAARLMATLRDHNPAAYQSFKYDADEEGVDLDSWIDRAIDHHAAA
jgi:hypothetical protein